MEALLNAISWERFSRRLPQPANMAEALVCDSGRNCAVLAARLTAAPGSPGRPLSPGVPLGPYRTQSEEWSSFNLSCVRTVGEGARHVLG